MQTGQFGTSGGRFGGPEARICPVCGAKGRICPVCRPRGCGFGGFGRGFGLECVTGREGCVTGREWRHVVRSRRVTGFGRACGSRAPGWRHGERSRPVTRLAPGDGGFAPGDGKDDWLYPVLGRPGRSGQSPVVPAIPSRPRCHPERSPLGRSRRILNTARTVKGKDLVRKVKDPSTPLRSAQDDRKGLLRLRSG